MPPSQDTRRPGLTRATVATGALRVLDREGLGGLSMRSVGAELGVQAMSLYHHVASKDDLLDAIAEQVIAEVEPGDPGLPWDEALRVLARRLRAAVLAHPHAAPLVASRPLASPAALAPVEASLAALRRGGLEAAAAVQAFWLLSSYLSGALVSEAAAAAEPRPVSIGPTDLPRDPDGQFPTLAELAPVISGSDYAAEFERGLDTLLAAIAPRPTGASSPTPGTAPSPCP
jgi:AcrR family transcriptional regulator